ncbi:MAG: glycosyltransferase [Acidobacteriaceae bacterium]|nr:glycosyltransferase [Acidobacteriaceae bacterium]
MISAERPLRVLAFMEASVVNGAAKTLLNFCDALRDQGTSFAEIAIVTFHRDGFAQKDCPNEFVRAVRTRGLEAIVIPERRALDPSIPGSLRRIVAERNPDILQTNNVKSHFLVRLSGIHRNRRWIAFHHGYTATDMKVKLYNQLDRWSLRAADRVVTVCGPFREQLTEAGIPAGRVTVLHNSATVLNSAAKADAQPVRIAYGIADETQVLLSIGRLSFEKGHADLIRALALLRDSDSSLRWTLMVVGSGPEQARLEALTRELDLSDKVIIVGQQSDVLPFYAAADVMVLPSHSEGSPHVVLEGMSFGIPIVATRVGGVPEILTDGETATLVEARNIRAMADGIRAALRNPAGARARAATAKLVLQERFSHTSYLKQMLTLYREVSGQTCDHAVGRRT